MVYEGHTAEEGQRFGLTSTQNTSENWCSSRGQQLEEGSSQGYVQSGIDFETFITTGLLRDPVCHAGDEEGTWPHPSPAGRGPDGADDRTPDDIGKELNFRR